VQHVARCTLQHCEIEITYLIAEDLYLTVAPMEDRRIPRILESIDLYVQWQTLERGVRNTNIIHIKISYAKSNCACLILVKLHCTCYILQSKSRALCSVFLSMKYQLNGTYYNIQGMQQQQQQQHTTYNNNMLHITTTPTIFLPT